MAFKIREPQALEWADKPGSVEDDHLSRMHVAMHL